MKTIKDIRDLKPCYDPSRYLSENWTGDAQAILEHPDIPILDKIWVVRNWIDDKTLRLFSIWCAHAALSLIENPDPRSFKACDVAEHYANGQATERELRAVYDAARDAAYPARDAAYAAAYAAAYPARDAAHAAADAAAHAAAYAAADAAARDTFLCFAIGKLRAMILSEQFPADDFKL